MDEMIIIKQKQKANLDLEQGLILEMGLRK